MRLILITLAGLVLIAAPAFADHDHGKKKPKNADAAQTMPENHLDHEVMDHGAMDHNQHKMGDQTMPKDGTTLHHPPKMIGMKFGHAMKVETITISTLTGEMIDLDVSSLGKTDHAMVKAPELQPDDYIVDWRAKGADGHTMSGSFSFTVEAREH